MRLPFSADQFLEVFRVYNLAVWPAQIGFYLFGVGLAAAASLRRPAVDRGLACFLAVAWLWTGGLYHIGFFSRINPVAYGFGAGFLVAGILFGYAAWRGTLRFRWAFDLRRAMAGAMLVYALLIYPLLGAHFGHGWPHAPLFGVAPCPTTIFTFGILLLAERPPRHLLIVPLCWSLIAFTAALQLGIYEDFMLPVSGLLTTGLILWDRRAASA